VSLEFEK